MLVFNLHYKAWSVYRTPAFCGASGYYGKIYFTCRYLNAHQSFYGMLFSSNGYTTTEESYPLGRNLTVYGNYANEYFTQRISQNWNDL